jgi:ABC-2 type transport system permease protein
MSAEPGTETLVLGRSAEIDMSETTTLRRFFDITWVLAATGLKARYFGSFFGYLWSLIRPLALFGVLYFVFTEIVTFGGPVEDYPLKLLLGLFLASYFIDVTTKALSSLVDQDSVLRAIAFPSAAVPLSVALMEALHLGLNMVVVVGAVLISGITPTASWLELVPLLALFVAFTVAISFPLSLLYVSFRDMESIWAVGSQLLFWGTPLVYVIETAPDGIQEILMMNPLAVVITQLRHALIDPAAPSAAEAAGGEAMLLIPLALTAGLLLLGIAYYRHAAAQIAERL